MARRNPKNTTRTKPKGPVVGPDNAVALAEADKASSEDAVAEALEQGFFGAKVDPLPNSAHSLESGPDSPGVLEAAEAANAARTASLRQGAAGK